MRSPRAAGAEAPGPVAHRLRLKDVAYAEVEAPCCEEEPHGVAEEGHDRDGLVVELRELHRVDGSKDGLLHLVPASAKEERAFAGDAGRPVAAGRASLPRLVTPTSMVTSVSYRGFTASYVGFRRLASVKGMSSSARQARISPLSRRGKEYDILGPRRGLAVPPGDAEIELRRSGRRKPGERGDPGDPASQQCFLRGRAEPRGGAPVAE